jgi:hypothetical protein
VRFSQGRGNKLQSVNAIPVNAFSDPVKIAPSVAQQISQSIKH